MSFLQSLSEFSPPKPKFTEADLPDLSGKNYLITGGAAGIGKELARMLYSANATVYIAGRSLENIETAKAEITDHPTAGKPAKGKILPVILDLGDLPTIKPAVKEFEKQASRLEVVFLNAGVMIPPAGSKTKQGLELQWGTNVVGHFLLQQLLLPLLKTSAKESGSVRIVWTSSDGANSSPSPDGINWEDINNSSGKMNRWSLYCQSKAGNVILANETASRYGSEGILSASLNPGHLKTDLQRHTPSLAVKMIGPIFLHEARFGGLTELYAGFSDTLSPANNGVYFIPWGRPGTMAPHIAKGLAAGSGKRLWTILEKEVEVYL